MDFSCSTVCSDSFRFADTKNLNICYSVLNHVFLFLQTRKNVDVEDNVVTRTSRKTL